MRFRFISITVSLLFILGESLGQKITVLQKATCKNKEIKLSLELPPITKKSYCVQYLGTRFDNYYFSTCETVLFDTAEVIGQSIGGHLATSNTKEVNEYLGNLMKEAHWIGYKQNPKSPLFNDPPDPSSGFEWMSGAPNLETFWASPGEPDNREDSRPGMTTVQNCNPSRLGFWCDAEPPLRFKGLLESKFRNPPTSNYLIKWSTGDTTKNLTVVDLNQKIISVEIKTDAQSQAIKLQISLDSLIIPSPTTYAEISIKSTKNNKTALASQNKGNYLYSWDPTQDLDKSTSASVIQTFSQDIRYTLTVTSKEGCTATEKFFLFADPITPPTAPIELKIANVFSPNNDQINDTYYLPFQTQLTDFKAEIFNRWGERIFETTDALFKWDGRYQGEIVSEGKYLLKVYYRENEKEVKWVQPIMVIK